MYFSDIAAGLRPELLSGLQRLWSVMAAPGTWWSGAERVAIAAAARGDGSGALPITAAGAARTIYADITSTSRDWVESLVEAGLPMPAFVEIIGIVSRLSAVDEFTRALGVPLEPLPEPGPGEPARLPTPQARPGRLWVPTVGVMSITNALSLVPAESAAQEKIHGPLYMSYEQMADDAFERELNRAQMELVAARVSAINECFY